VSEARRITRRSLIDHLRQNDRGLVVLDQVELRDVTAVGPLLILGDDVMVSGSTFLAGRSAVGEGI
jgi:hypothetical protein